MLYRPLLCRHACICVGTKSSFFFERPMALPNCSYWSRLWGTCAAPEWREHLAAFPSAVWAAVDYLDIPVSVVYAWIVGIWVAGAISGSLWSCACWWLRCRLSLRRAPQSSSSAQPFVGLPRRVALPVARPVYHVDLQAPELEPRGLVRVRGVQRRGRGTVA